MTAGLQAVSVREDGPVCWIRLGDGARGSTLGDRLVAECARALAACERWASVVVLEGAPEAFCLGADLDEVTARRDARQAPVDAGPLYDLWRRLATGPFVTVSHVRGRANAGGMGFVAASDVVLADATARFSLSELLFGLYPACVLPFLVRKIGFQRSHYLTLTAQPIAVAQAHAWGLVDAYEASSDALVARHLLRLRRLSKAAVARYKAYAAGLAPVLEDGRCAALAANREMFSDPDALEAIGRFVAERKLPWEA